MKRTLSFSHALRRPLIVLASVASLAVGIGCGEESAQEKLAEKQLEQIEKAEEEVEGVPLCTDIVAAAKAGECIDE